MRLRPLRACFSQVPALHGRDVLADLARSLNGCFVPFSNIDLIEEKVHLFHIVHLACHILSKGVEAKCKGKDEFVFDAGIARSILPDDFNG